MPELPEVEVTRRRLEPGVVGKRITGVVLRTPKLRITVPPELASQLPGRTIRSLARRGKYLLFDCETGWLLVHLGMTGFLRLLPSHIPAGKHDHFELQLEGEQVVRLHDSRKFGTIAWTSGDPLVHPLIRGMGPEPFAAEFMGEYLYSRSRGRRVTVKQFIMDSAMVAGIGNIYANEALFIAGIRPDRSADSLDLSQCSCLAGAIKSVLRDSVDVGSTYRVAEEEVTYHPLQFAVYGRGGEACRRCRGVLEEVRLGNRSSVYCPVCQG